MKKIIFNADNAHFKNVSTKKIYTNSTQNVDFKIKMKKSQQASMIY